MPTLLESRIAFGNTLRALRAERNLSLRALEELCGVVYTMISSIEHADRAAGADVTARLADALGLAGEEREAFLLAAAGTRRRDKLVGYARELAPEILNFVPRVLARAGLDLGRIQRCELVQCLGAERSQLVQGLKKAVAGDQGGEFLVVDAGGKRFVCALAMVPTT